MRNRRASLLAALLALGACGDDDRGDGGSGRPQTTEGPRPAIAEVPGDRESLGAQVALQSGCLGCHRLGSAGNAGPGNELTRIGAKLPASAIERALLHPKPPMPSYESLPRDQRRALVKYLASLR